MDMSGEQRIRASREAVWNALNDPDVLWKCIPHCESVSRTSPTEMVATVKLSLGPFSTSFKSNLVMTNLNPPESYTILAEGSGTLAGFARGTTDISLSEQNGETVLNYRISAKIGGRLALLGSRLIDSASRKFAGRFFDKFGKIVVARNRTPGAARA